MADAGRNTNDSVTPPRLARCQRSATTQPSERPESGASGQGEGGAAGEPPTVYEMAGQPPELPGVLIALSFGRLGLAPRAVMKPVISCSLLLNAAVCVSGSSEP